MIDKHEVETKAEEFAIHPANVQRDYVFGWVLAGIYAESALRDSLVLKGGNAFRKAYFEHARFSGDLDFASTKALPADAIRAELGRVCDFIHGSTEVVFEKGRTRVDEQHTADPDKKMFKARLYFKDFYGNPDKFTISIRVDINPFDRVLLPVQQRNLVHPYSDWQSCEIPLRCLKIEELLAGKLKCLLQRRHSADLYDFVFSVLLNPDIDVNRSEIVSTFLRMTIFRPSPGVVRGLLVDLPFQVMRGLWHKYLVFPKNGLIDFDKAVDLFKTTVNELFGPLPIGRGQLAYFPSHLRNPIMEAGYGMTVLDIMYDGVRRQVEPYSLTYKTRKDGVAREYLYVYDRTGGNRRGPGLKTFVHPKIQHIANTDTEFEPRYQVELSKAGEAARSSYFARPTGRSISTYATPRRRRVRSPARGFGPRYVLECGICGKRFRRKKYSTKLNPHKDRYGNQCYGRIGYML